MSTRIEAARNQMVNQQVRAWDVLDPSVLAVLATVPREQFVPPRYRNLAFADTAIPLRGNQVMMTPQVEGRLLQALAIRGPDRVLEVGTGSGFLTACLGRLAASVTSLEILPELADEARRNLRTVSTWNAEVLTADVFSYRPDAPWDVIAVTGSVPAPDERFQHWLADGGRLFIVTGEDPLMHARLVTRQGPDRWVTTILFETSLPALLNAPLPPRFKF
ncbi:MAG: protein-L-isoaspartate O-methyltransferase [Gammaproteobacteria bacterium]|nr:protein-L-isoaspartate O-methyltransferase [Gammaproteobacteria bacterium]